MRVTAPCGWAASIQGLFEWLAKAGKCSCLRAPNASWNAALQCICWDKTTKDIPYAHAHAHERVIDTTQHALYLVKQPCSYRIASYRDSLSRGAVNSWLHNTTAVLVFLFNFLKKWLLKTIINYFIYAHTHKRTITAQNSLHASSNPSCLQTSSPDTLLPKLPHLTIESIFDELVPISWSKPLAFIFCWCFQLDIKKMKLIKDVSE